jgi:hypothetical protein
MYNNVHTEDLEAVMDYYRQLEPIVLAHVTHYREDFTESDRKALEGFEGEFLLGMRSTGTNLLRFGGDAAAEDAVQGLFEGDQTRLCDLVDAFLFRANDRFIHGKDGQIVEVDREKAKRIFEGARKRVERFFA